MSTLAEALAPRSDQLNADDLIPGPRVIKITGARIAKDDRQVKIVINFEGDQGKPWKPCKTMGRAMVVVWEITDPTQLVGKSLRLYRDPEVKFGDQGAVGGIRISHMSNIDSVKRVKLTVSQGKKAEFTFHPLLTEQPVETGEDDARDAIENAASIADLERVWKMKIMAPFRDALRETMELRKATLSEPNGTLTALIAQYDAATSPAALTTADKAADALGLADDPGVVTARESAMGRGL